MRLRNTLVTAVGAFALALTLPAASASAATGQSRYTYVNEEGYELVGFMNAPESERCINLAGLNDALPPAHSPKNRTDATATVFLNADCEGEDFFTLRPHTGGGSERLKVRSVVFS
ncbi:hypothetical protein J7E96_33795 [Streptomyces sp. ISL-96]|uniref:hypothetical protein n=1 Tax=Streptomyces sp. ISL-96 TaxID=2819191 RepID=UPI001BE4F178|nr:hypothetical protein [Streptomyces sp. ISL-96]MBT2493388.1 hypothetical protein [Streptomyces sp. ISL-96]